MFVSCHILLFEPCNIFESTKHLLMTGKSTRVRLHFDEISTELHKIDHKTQDDQSHQN